MKVLLFYELAPGGMAKIQENYPGHVARLTEFHARGVLLMAGPYGSPPVGALAVFTDRGAAEEFATGDPFVLGGVVGKHTFHEWNESLS